MADIVVGLILIIVISVAVYSIYKGKKNGRRCMGCPSAGSCTGNCCSGGKKE